MTTNFKKRLDAIESLPYGARDVQSLSDDELWALLPAWWRTVPDAVFEELALLSRKTDEGRQRYRELKKMYGAEKREAS